MVPVASAAFLSKAIIVEPVLAWRATQRIEKPLPRGELEEL